MPINTARRRFLPSANARGFRAALLVKTTAFTGSFSTRKETIRAAAGHPSIQLGAQVFSKDGHAVGKVIEVLTDEFLIEEGHLVKHVLAFRYAGVQQATDTRVDLVDDLATIKETGNVVTLRDAHGHDRHVTQVGITPTHTVPTYDEVQTTTGGPPTGEADV